MQTSIRIQDHPPITFMPVPRHRPGWFDHDMNAQIEWADEPAMVISDTPRKAAVRDTLIPNPKAKGPLSIQFNFPVLPMGPFVRFLAKVAHGVAFSQFRFDFTPWLLDLIEGKNVESAGAVIGAPVADVPEPLFDLWHRVNIALIPSKEGKVIGITLNLFAGIGGPPYFVLAGHVSKGMFDDWGRYRKIAPVMVPTKV